MLELFADYRIRREWISGKKDIKKSQFISILIYLHLHLHFDRVGYSYFQCWIGQYVKRVPYYN